jgi:high-affinity Fe2+/Pb2+ permease
MNISSNFYFQKFVWTSVYSLCESLLSLTSVLVFLNVKCCFCWVVLIWSFWSSSSWVSSLSSSFISSYSSYSPSRAISNGLASSFFLMFVLRNSLFGELAIFLWALLFKSILLNFLQCWGLSLSWILG